jgi:CMP/dCMP kinase
MISSRSARPLIIAIDGYSSCGKSTLAKQIAKELGYVFVDTGAMYRAVTFYFIQHHIDIDSADSVEVSLADIHIEFRIIDGANTTFLNGQNIEKEIRSLMVSELVSEVAAISSVRRKLVDLQRKMAGSTGLVMDGRDIGTVVFPNADIKIFVTADPGVRAQRRYLELMSKGQHVSIQEIVSNLAHRDEIDTTRADSPLRQAEDAIVLDNTHYTIDEQFDFVMRYVSKRLQE